MTTPNPNFSAPVPGGQGSVPGAPVSKTKWIVQLIVGTLCLGNLVTLILAILGLTKADTDLETANKYYKWGWIIYAIWAVISIIGIILYFVLIAAAVNSGNYETY